MQQLSGLDRVITANRELEEGGGMLMLQLLVLT